uniref:Uncharacterized protein n=1 Tax=Moniliophthora roreri TaxID=221103 RepID=A0A0W0ETZ3_MONRR
MNLSTPLSHRACKPLTREQSPTHLNEHDYSPPPPHIQHLLLCSDQKSSNPIPPIIALTMNNDSMSQTNSPLPMNQLTPEHRSVWDDEDLDDEPEEMQPVDRSRSPTPRTMERTEEVYARLCALCADWRNTAPLTAGSIVARSALNVHLDIYLVIVTTDEGLEEL